MDAIDKPSLSKTLFWDIRYDTIQWDRNYRFVIERVLERGTFAEWPEIKRYYGLEKIKETACRRAG